MDDEGDEDEDDTQQHSIHLHMLQVFFHPLLQQSLGIWMTESWLSHGLIRNYPVTNPTHLFLKEDTHTSLSFTNCEYGCHVFWRKSRSSTVQRWDRLFSIACVISSTWRRWWWAIEQNFSVRGGRSTSTSVCFICFNAEARVGTVCMLRSKCCVQTPESMQDLAHRYACHVHLTQVTRSWAVISQIHAAEEY